MGLSSDKIMPKAKDKCVCNNIPKIVNINYNKGIITYICEEHGKKEINIKDYFKKDRKYSNNSTENMICNEEETKQFIKLIKDKRDILQYIINFFDTFIRIYNNNPKNYYNNINISNIAQNIRYKVLVEESDIYSGRNDFDSLLKNIDSLKLKLLYNFNQKFNVNLTGNEKEIDLTGKSLNNTDLEALCSIYFKNLEKLKLKNNNINNIESVKNLKSSNLKEIDLSENQIEDIKPLQDLGTNKLKYLNLEDNNISNIEPLGIVDIKNKGLKKINLRNNKIKSIELLSRGVLNIALKNIILDNNKFILKDVDHLEKTIMNGRQKTLKIIDEIEIGDSNLFIVYRIKQKDKSIKIFGENFVKKNEDNFKIIIEGKEMNLVSNYKCHENQESLKVKLINNKPINDLSNIFQGCSNLLYLGEDSINTEDVTDMSYAFDGCTLLEDLDGISKFKTEKVKNMSFMFRGCTSLENLDLLENWKIKNVIYMNSMFENCSNLKSLDGLSKWETKNVIDMNSMFRKCSLLSSISGISNFNIDKVKNMSYMFYKCFCLSSLDDISNWKIKKDVNTTKRFQRS